MRASRASAPRTFWITDRTAAMAPTPMATQRKKKISRCQEARSLAGDHAKDESHRAAPSDGGLAAVSHRRALRRGVLDDAAVPQHDLLIGAGRQLAIVGDQNERGAARAVARPRADR